MIRRLRVRSWTGSTQWRRAPRAVKLTSTPTTSSRRRFLSSANLARWEAALRLRRSWRAWRDREAHRQLHLDLLHTINQAVFYWRASRHAGGFINEERTGVQLKPAKSSARHPLTGRFAPKRPEYGGVFALVLPPSLVVVVLGRHRAGGYKRCLPDSLQVVTKLTREGSNLISRDSSLQDATTAMASMSTRPVNFNNGSSKLIFSVIKNVPTPGAANANKGSSSINAVVRKFLWREHRVQNR